MKKAGGHISWNVVEITIKMKTIVRKPLMIKIASIQVWRKQSCQRRIPLEEKEDYLSSIWLCTYRYVIAWAVTSDCAHTSTSLHGDNGRKCYYYSTHLMLRLQSWSLENVEYPFIAITPSSTLIPSGSTS